ncbi:tau-tubulin kinase 1-like isoform X2 [Portunus trituberculatus]|uniref:tau-tubulin kinase 1-like isoform X2 n=1 Tax=Portunus trituberculatus TaxID=210409 RepID=UPI001E1CCD7E|nr:tau-tubulin kinase 1-like isoform X2 [Portunus trituberculatus]
MAPPRKLSHSCSAGLLPTFRRLQVGGDGQVVAPTPARSPALHRGSVTIPHAGGLLRVWAEVRSGALHVYPQRAAALPSLVVAHLAQCRVSLTCLAGPSPAHCVLVHRKGREEVRLLLETREEAEVWVGMLQVTAVSRSLQLEGLNLECGAAECFPLGGEGVAGAEGVCLERDAAEDEEEEEEEEEEDGEEDEERSTQETLANLIDLLQPFYCGDDVGSGSSCDAESPEEEEDEEEEEARLEGRERGQKEGCSTPLLSSSSSYTTMVEGTEVRLRHPPRLSPDEDAGRRELLQQMLTTKSLLEKKQKNRRSGAGAWAVTAGEIENEYDRAQHEAQLSALRKAVILRQRKNSTAIKMATLERQQSSKGKKQKQRKQKTKGDGGGGGGGGNNNTGGGGVGVWAWDGTGGEASGGGGCMGVTGGDVTHQLEALRRRLSALDCELRESKQDTERTLQDLQQRREQELHLIKDLGGVAGDLPLAGGGAGGMAEMTLAKSSNGGSLMGSLSSIPSIVVSSSPTISSSSSSSAVEKKTSEKIFGIKVGGSKEGRSKARNPLHFLDLKLRVSRRHKSTECLSARGASTPTPDRHSSTPGNGSYSDNSSDEETDNLQQPRQPPTASQLQAGRAGLRTEVSVEALREIEAFKQLIQRYFATHPRHDSITSHSREILL